MKYKIPPYTRWTIRATGSFSIQDTKGNILGPDDATSRRFTVETADAGLALDVQCAEDTKLSVNQIVRPSRYEQNSGIPVEIAAPIAEPTIQELIRMYIRESTDAGPEVETPEEFFDFDLDEDEGELLRSQYEYEDMDEEPIPPAGDSQESPAPQAEAEPEKESETQETP
jgi:hypothetical protein